MNKRTLVSSLLLAGALGATSSAYAIDDGHLDGQWFNVRVKTVVKKEHAVDWTGAGPWNLTSSNIKFDSGKNNCYAGLHWNGAGSQSYDLEAVCNGPGGWESVDTATLSEMADGHLGDDWDSLYLPAQGASANPWTEWAGYEGTFNLKTKFKKDGSVKNVKMIQPKDGLVYYGDDPSDIYGTTRSGFKIKNVDVSKVPAEAVACFDDVLAEDANPGDGVIPNCGG